MIDTHRANLACILRTARRGSGLKQKAVAHRMGVHASAVKRWELGQARVTVDSLLAYCDVVGLDPIAVIQELKRLKRTNTQLG